MTAAENLLKSWVFLNNLIKNTRMTRELSYNESVIMLLLYNEYKDNEGSLSIKEIAKKTRMLKSLINRTVNSLEEKGMIRKFADKNDKRTVRIQCISDNMDLFLKVHSRSLSITQKVVDIIGEEDAEAFCRLVSKLQAAEEEFIKHKKKVHSE